MTAPTPFPAAVARQRSRLCHACGLVHPCGDPIALCSCPDPACGSDQVETILLRPWRDDAASIRREDVRPVAGGAGS